MICSLRAHRFDAGGNVFGDRLALLLGFRGLRDHLVQLPIELRDPPLRQLYLAVQARELAITGGLDVFLGTVGLQQDLVGGGLSLGFARSFFLFFLGRRLGGQFLAGLGPLLPLQREAGLAFELDSLLRVFRWHHVAAFTHAFVVRVALDARFLRQHRARGEPQRARRCQK